ncbi:YcxB family protein [Actinoplanes philippinensis]|uniref:YcxB family protein n=1 Tax=Actinoplanes philippinensis TaxID=35752 RepID=UPI003406CFF1
MHIEFTYARTRPYSRRILLPTAKRRTQPLTVVAGAFLIVTLVVAIGGEFSGDALLVAALPAVLTVVSLIVAGWLWQRALTVPDDRLTPRTWTLTAETYSTRDPSAAANSPAAGPDSAPVAADVPTVAANSATTATDSPTVAGNSATTATDSPTVAADFPTVTANSATVAPDSATVAADSPTVAADFPTVTADSATVAGTKSAVAGLLTEIAWTDFVSFRATDDAYVLRHRAGEIYDVPREPLSPDQDAEFAAFLREVR